MIYQAVGDTTQQDLFNRSEHSERMEAFITMLGTKVELAKHEGYFGGLHNFAKEIQQNGEQDKITSGVYSLYTDHDNKGVMFHVSTLLPTRVDGADSQQIEVRCLLVYLIRSSYILIVDIYKISNSRLCHLYLINLRISEEKANWQ